MPNVLFILIIVHLLPSQLPDAKTFLTDMLEELGLQYDRVNLRPPPTKTKLLSFPLRSKQVSQKLQVIGRASNWNTVLFSNSSMLLWPCADLLYKNHCQNMKQKSLLKEQYSLETMKKKSSWGTHPQTVRNEVFDWCCSAGEYTSLMWYASTNAMQAGTESYRTITGCQKATSID